MGTDRRHEANLKEKYKNQEFQRASRRNLSRSLLRVNVNMIFKSNAPGQAFAEFILFGSNSQSLAAGLFVDDSFRGKT
jgi:hypothetical protein